jgi:hypothetical protein
VYGGGGGGWGVGASKIECPGRQVSSIAIKMSSSVTFAAQKPAAGASKVEGAAGQVSGIAIKMSSSVAQKPKRAPKVYVTFKVVTEVVLSEADIREMVQEKGPFTRQQMDWVIKSLLEAGEAVELEGPEGSDDPLINDLVRERVLDEVDNLDGPVECDKCTKDVYPQDEDGVWEKCVGGDHYLCAKCSKPAELAEEEEEAEEQ